MRCNNCFGEYDEELGVCPYCGFMEGQSPKEAYMLFAGTMLQARYIVGTVLGFGGFGITYKAYDTKLERMVAIKEYYPSGLVYRTPGTRDVIVFKGKRYKDYTDGLKRFLDEARNATKFINNPNIIDIMEYFEENSTAYYVMELLVGLTLGDFLQECGGKMDSESSITIISAIGEALKDIHRLGYLHRDISPDNIYICDNGKIKLIDFGAARFSANDKLSVILKPGYAPAEQYESVNKQGAYTDVYALGATLYRMVTGVKPDESTNRKMEDMVPSPIELVPELSLNLSNAIMRAMAVEVHLRYQTVADFMNAITREKKVRSVESVKKRKKNFRWIGIAASVLIVVGLVLYFSRNWNKQKDGATLPDAEITLWYLIEEGEEESHKVKGITQAIEDFMAMYENVAIHYSAIPADEYQNRLSEALNTERMPDLYESTGLPAKFLTGSTKLGAVLSHITPENTYFLDRYTEYYPSENRIPTSFIMPVIYINTLEATIDGEMLTDLRMIRAADEKISYSVDEAWEEYYENELELVKYENGGEGIDSFLKGEVSVYLGSSGDMEKIYEVMAGKCRHVTLQREAVECRAGSTWSISSAAEKDKITVAERFLAYLVEDPTAQDYLYMQGDYGDKSKLPINKAAIAMLISDDAQFYGKILEEADSFRYRGD